MQLDHNNKAQITRIVFLIICIVASSLVIGHLILYAKMQNAISSDDPVAVRWIALFDPFTVNGRESTGIDSEPFLVTAVRCGHLKAARALLNHGVNHNDRDTGGRSALHWAAKEGDLQLMAILVNAGFSINAKDCIGWTPLHFAVEKGDNRITIFLLKRGANPSLLDTKGWSPMILAARSGRRDIADALLKYGAFQDVPEIYRAASFGDSVRLERLLRNDGRRNLNRTDKGGWSALTYAASNGQIEVARILLQAGAKITPIDLESGVSSGSLPLVQELVAHGADVNTRAVDSPNSPLSIAAADGNKALVKFLLAKGADPTAKVQGYTAWEMADRCGHTKLARYIRSISTKKSVAR